MSASVDHPSFEQPENANAKLWRYMDFTKFVSLLASSSLFLSRADLLGDPFEGSYSKANIDLRPTVYKNLGPGAFDAFNNLLPKVSEWVRQWMYINCWHMNENESAAMWKLYAHSNEAVAIQTIYSKLINVLPSELYVGLVKYIDYDKDWMPEGILFYPFMHKRKSFSHENEVRIIKSDWPLEGGEKFINKLNSLSGIYININLEELIENVYVAPTAPQWYFDLVNDVTNKFGIKKKVLYSKLDETPVY